MIALCAICDWRSCGVTVVLSALGSDRKHFDSKSDAIELICPACDKAFPVLIAEMEPIRVSEDQLLRNFFGGRRSARAKSAGQGTVSRDAASGAIPSSDSIAVIGQLWGSSRTYTSLRSISTGSDVPNSSMLWPPSCDLSNWRISLGKVLVRITGLLCRRECIHDTAPTTLYFTRNKLTNSSQARYSSSGQENSSKKNTSLDFRYGARIASTKNADVNISASKLTTKRPEGSLRLMRYAKLESRQLICWTWT